MSDDNGCDHYCRLHGCKCMKNYMFQYATRHKIYEDTDRITLEEAELLKEKWLEHIKEHWNEIESPEMCIWMNCTSDTDYGDKYLDIDYRDCEFENGHFYKIVKTKII